MITRAKQPLGCGSFLFSTHLPGLAVGAWAWLRFGERSMCTASADFWRIWWNLAVERNVTAASKQLHPRRKFQNAGRPSIFDTPNELPGAQ